MLAAVVCGSVLAIGTVHLPVLLVVAAGAFGAAAAALYRSAEARRGAGIPLPAMIFAALAAYTLLQAVPIPMAWLKVLAPANADIWERSLLPFGEAGPSLASISLDPGASVVEALKWSTYAAVFTAASSLGARKSAGWGVAMVFGTALAAAFTTMAHGLLGATKVYGLYQPNFNVLAWHVGPLLNPNNLAGYLNLGILSGLGLLLAHRPIVPRWVVGFGVALMVAIDVTSASRGGVLTLPLGVVALALITARREKQGWGTDKASTWLLIAVVVGGAVLAILGGNAKAWAELYDKNLSKGRMVLWLRPLIADHPLVGIGRGAFESVFPAYRVTPGNVVFTHAENFPLQWAAEWGLPVALAALVALAWALSPRRLGVTRSALAAGAWLGVAVLLVQNLVDLALEVPAVCIGAATLLGSLWGDPVTHGTHRRAVREPLAQRWPRLVPVAVGVLGAALIAGTVRFGWHDVASDRAAVWAALDGVKAPRAGQMAPLRDEVRHAMLRHPAEPYFSLVGGMAAFRARDQSPIPWIQRTLERGQVNGRAHLLLAEVLAARGSRRQALLELRLTLENEQGLLVQVASLAVRWTQDFDELLSVLPEGKEGAGVLAEMARLLAAPPRAGEAPPDPLLRSRCDREAIRRDPALIPPHAREAEARLAGLAKGAPPGLCVDREHCRAEVLEHADAIAAAQPDASLPVELRARLLMSEDRPDEAVKMLEKACEQVTERASCLQVRVNAAALLKAPGPVDAAIKALLGASCVSAEACANTATWLSAVRLSRGETGAALALLSRAAREDPSTDARWVKLADAASQAGAHAQAADALETVARRQGDPELRRRADAERALARGGLLLH
jgi:tetratricopeptide (TPR) repeat protein